MAATIFDLEEARRIGESIGIYWKDSPFDVSEFRKGLLVELEHGSCDPQTNVTNDDPVLTGKIALAHLKEFPDYYKRLEVMEKEAERYHQQLAASRPRKIWSGHHTEKTEKKKEDYSPSKNIWSGRR
ncbi:MAG: DUF5661 family protein [Candidatus Altiarchaeia archaeon]